MQVVPAAGSTLRSACKSVAVDAGQPCPAFPTRACALAREAWQRVYADRASPFRAERGQLLQLLRQHLQDGLLRIGKRWLRQTRGIPQASRALTRVFSRRKLTLSLLNFCLHQEQANSEPTNGIHSSFRNGSLASLYIMADTIPVAHMEQRPFELAC